jgi:hypothetical protein
VALTAHLSLDCITDFRIVVGDELHNFINHNDTPFLVEVPQRQKDRRFTALNL